MVLERRTKLDPTFRFRTDAMETPDVIFEEHQNGAMNVRCIGNPIQRGTI